MPTENAATGFVPLPRWGFLAEPFFLVAGPCGAESEAQLLSTARSLAATGRVGVFRAGVWKPRTRPGSFEGVGEVGLGWLAAARRETGLPVGVEVGTARHVELSLKHGMDLLWIGARTTTDPFATQAIAEAARGADVPILVKNPMSPDPALWMGAIERFAALGHQKLGAVHRGFASTRPRIHRFDPLWRIPIELKRAFPGLPLLCDPSHLCGRRDLIGPAAQEALDLLFDGLMIEVHEDPDHALSDREQQLDPEAFRALLGRLRVRSEAIGDDALRAAVRALRLEVDELDHALVALLGKRMEVVRKLGRLKRRHGISAFQPERWNEIVASRTADAAGTGLPEAFALEIFRAVHEEALRQQEAEPEEGD